MGFVSESRAYWREVNNLPILANNLASLAEILKTVGQFDRAFENTQKICGSADRPAVFGVRGTTH